MRSFKMTNMLIVDDDPGVKNMLQGILSMEGYYTDIASDGAEALIFLRSEERSSACFVVLLDILMPQLDGFEFLEEAIKDEQVWPRIHGVIILSGLVNSNKTGIVARVNQMVETTVRSVPVQLLSKPFTVPQLLAVLEAVAATLPSPNQSL